MVIVTFQHLRERNRLAERLSVGGMADMGSEEKTAGTEADRDKSLER